MMFFRSLAELSATNALIFMSNLVPRVTHAAIVGGAPAGGTAACGLRKSRSREHRGSDRAGENICND
jgi:hypothetical protein